MGLFYTFDKHKKIMAKQQLKSKPKTADKAATKSASRVTKTFAASDKPYPAKTKTIDSLKKLGYSGDPSSVHRIPGTKNVSIDYVKPKKK